MNDYLNGACGIDRVLTDCSSDYVANGKIFVGLANPSTEAIREMISNGRKWEMKALARLLSLRNSLLKELSFDHVIFDASPGLQFSSINAVVSADVVFVVATPERSDLEGSPLMISELYELFEKKTQVIANQVPVEFIPSRNLESKLTDPESIQSPIVGVIACSCDIRKAEGGCFLVCQKPNHQFTKVLQEIAAKIEH